MGQAVSTLGFPPHILCSLLDDVTVHKACCASDSLFLRVRSRVGAESLRLCALWVCSSRLRDLTECSGVLVSFTFPQGCHVVSLVPGEVEGHQDSRRKELGPVVGLAGMGSSNRFQGGCRDNALPL